VPPDSQGLAHRHRPEAPERRRDRWATNFAETIYRVGALTVTDPSLQAFIATNTKQGWHRKHRHRGSWPALEPKIPLGEFNLITEHPRGVEDRDQPGHREDDLIIHAANHSAMPGARKGLHRSICSSRAGHSAS